MSTTLDSKPYTHQIYVCARRLRHAAYLGRFEGHGVRLIS
jgi:hypothetical protein